MAAPIMKYDVYLSYHGSDLPKELLSQLHNTCASKGITTFKDEGNMRGKTHTIGPEFVQAIRESKALIVVLSPNYGSSRWCLDELVEIFKCQQASGQIVITIFHNVAPSIVRLQRGYFGRIFDKTCELETEQVKKSWSNALRHVGSRRGTLTQNWDDEAAMVKSIAKDVKRLLFEWESEQWKQALANHSGGELASGGKDSE